MINLYNQVPSIYSSASRDFQYLSWLINIVLNSVKHNVDDIYNLPSNTDDPRLTELLAMTLGFKIKRNYDKKQLTALVAVLSRVLKCKGTKKAVEMAAEALVKSVGSLGSPEVDIKDGELLVTLPQDLTDITLFMDLLDYILPAGMTYRINRKAEDSKSLKSMLKHRDTLNMLLVDDYVWGLVDDNNDNVHDVGLASLYDLVLNEDNAMFAGNIKIVNGKPVVNAGLQSNIVIPVVKEGEMVDIDDGLVLYTTEIDPDTGLTRHEPLMAGENEAVKTPLKAKNTLEEL